MSDLAGVLLRHWGLRAAAVRPLAGGMNSEAWTVGTPFDTYVAKRVSGAAVPALVTGSAIARELGEAGLVTGAPVPTRDGRLVVEEEGLVLLRRVPGRPLTGWPPEEQRWMAEVLVAVHRAGDPQPGTAVAAFLDGLLPAGSPSGGDLAWLEAALTAVRAEAGRLPTTWSFVHGDPAPEAFLRDDDAGTTGLIDWSGARRGPILYDVASAVMYLGGRERAAPFLEGYAAHGPLTAGELARLDAVLRVRWAVQGAYFARRRATDDRTGGVSPDDNERGLDDARRGLARLGLSSSTTPPSSAAR